MKKSLFTLVTLFVFLTCVEKILAQQYKYYWNKGNPIPDTTHNPKSQPHNKEFTITLMVNASDTSSDRIIKYKQNATSIFDSKVTHTGSINNFKIVPSMIKAIVDTFEFQFYKMNKKDTTPIGNILKIAIDHKKIADTSNKGNPDRGSPQVKTKEYWLKYCINQPTFMEPYDYKNNNVYLYFDENGKLLNSLPVNVDQNDRFYLNIISQKGIENNYSLKTIEGIYEPADLLIAPYTPVIKSGETKAESLEAQRKVEYTLKLLMAGPYTSDYFKFQITFDTTESGQTKKMYSEVYSIKINKLYHVGVGVSLINTTLSNPNFKTIYNGSDTTIQAFNSGNRTLVTFNVVWYWSVLQQDRKGSIITSGRDILKDEPTFSLRRIYPTVGVSLDNNFRENFFGGFVYEFARGGSIIAGAHYGKVNQLADKNFDLGKTSFHGTDTDIKVDQVYKASFFFGVTLDTRIFNILFGANK